MKPYTTIAVGLLALLALLQLTRFVLRWEVIVNGLVIPVWLSLVAFAIAGGLALMLWREARSST